MKEIDIKNLKPEYDFANLKEIVNEDDHLFTFMLNKFLESTEHSKAGLMAAKKTNDWPRVSETVHRMLPSIRFFELRTVEFWLMTIKKQIEDHEYNMIPELIDHIVIRIDGTFCEIREEMLKTGIHARQ